jgi:hypothetical protein
MSQFAAKDFKLDLKDVKELKEVKEVKPTEKTIILTEVDVSKEDLRELYKNCSVLNFDAEVQSDSNLLDLLVKFDCIIIDIRSPKDLKWFQLMRSSVENDQAINVVYLHQKGVPITTRDHLQKHLAVDYIVKVLPKKDEYNGKADFLFRLLSDHIPIKRNWFAVVKSVFSCILGSEDEQKKN